MLISFLYENNSKKVFSTKIFFIKAFFFYNSLFDKGQAHEKLFSVRTCFNSVVNCNLVLEDFIYTKV